MLDRVTITGADDSIGPGELAALSAKFPFVEWGILVSVNSYPKGSPRYPSVEWQTRLLGGRYEYVNLSIHIQGFWLRALLKGDYLPLLDGVGSICEIAQRLQFNFHGVNIDAHIDQFILALLKTPLAGKQYIFQHDGHHGGQFMAQVLDHYRRHDAYEAKLDCVAFFDTSHGTGVLPIEWPKSVSSGYIGYAGGLGPENLAEQIPLIAKATGKARFWIDMETRVRTNEKFDLNKVWDALKICEPFVGKEL